MKSNSYVIIYLLYLLSLNFASGLIPQMCVDNATKSGVCCPSTHWGDICGGFERGSCDRLVLQKSFIPSVFENDDRVNWPIRFFHTVCQCKSNYYGISCEECFFGWTGKYCDEKLIRIRRNILSLSGRERNLLVKVIDRSMQEMSNSFIFVEQHNSRSDPVISPEWIQPNVQYLMVFNHRFASRATLFTNNADCQNFGFLDFNHNSIGFLTWHRYYMMYWERELQKIASKYYHIHNFALPYWDWTDLDDCDICTNDLMGAEGIRHPEYGVLISQGSPFHNWTEYCVEPNSEFPCYGCHKAGYLGLISRSWNNKRFPNSEDIKFALRERNFYISNERQDLNCGSFHQRIEGLCGLPGFNDSRFFLHNRIHNMLDGSMCCSGTSPSDPLFMVHHIQIDRLFEKWFKIYKPSLKDYPDDNTRPGHGKYDNLVSWLPPIQHYRLFTPVKNLGYEYDNYDFGING